MKSEKKTFTAGDVVRRTAIIILCATMALLWGGYIGARLEAPQSENAGNFPAEHKWIFTSLHGAQEEPAIDGLQITPVFISLAESGKKKGCAYDDSLIKSVYANLRQYLTVLFSSKSVCRAVEGEEAEDMYMRAFDAGTNAFIMYDCEINSAAVSALNADSDLSVCDGSIGGANIRCIVIYVEQNGLLNACARDDSGNITLFTEKLPDHGYAFNKAVADEYNSNVGFCEFNFLYENTEDSKLFDGMPSDFPIVKTIKTSQKLLCAQPAERFAAYLDQTNASSELLQDEYIKKILSCFYINPILTKHYAADNSIIFADSSMSLAISPTGKLRYEAADGGIKIGTLIGSDSDKYSFAERVRAASVIAASLPAGIFGGEASLRLRSITFDSASGCVFFQFSYYYNGIRLTQITGENGPSVTVGITDEKIMYLSADMLSVNAAADSTTAIMPIRAAMVILRAENASYSARGASLCYVLKQNGYMFSADWAFSKSDTENGRKVE